MAKAIQDQADYVGIGAVYGTKTKALEQSPIGPTGVKELLFEAASLSKTHLPAVAIGGINSSNIFKTIYLSSSPEDNIKLDGVAVVSAIMASKTPDIAANELKHLLKQSFESSFTSKNTSLSQMTLDDIKKATGILTAKISQIKPLVHHITNDVVKNFSANVTIAIGASPVMSECPEDFCDLSAVPTCGCLINMGTPTVEGIKMYKKSIDEYNKRGKTLVFDPVGAGATKLRTDSCQELLEHGIFDAVKANDGEIFSAAQYEGGSKSVGVDSVGKSSNEERYKAAFKIAKKHRTVVLATGEEDVLVDEQGNCLIFSNGSEYLGKITGSGCSLGSLITTYIAADKGLAREDRDYKPVGPFIATAAALSLYTLASEKAAEKPQCLGPGTFIPNFIDELYLLQKAAANGNTEWLSNLKVTHYET